MVITVKYIDDFGHKHLAFVKTLKDVKFYQTRFDVVEFSVKKA